MVSCKASFDFYVEVRVEVLTQNLNALKKPRVSLQPSFGFHVEVRVEVATQNPNALQKPRVSLRPSFGFHAEVRAGVLTQNSNALQLKAAGVAKATMEMPCLFSWWGPVCKYPLCIPC